MAGKSGKGEDDVRRRAIVDLERAGAHSEIVGTSATRRQAERARAHFTAADADPDDKMEVWGRRIGRGLSVIAFAMLLFYLAVTYL